MLRNIPVYKSKENQFILLIQCPIHRQNGKNPYCINSISRLKELCVSLEHRAILILVFRLSFYPSPVLVHRL